METVIICKNLGFIYGSCDLKCDIGFDGKYHKKIAFKNGYMNLDESDYVEKKNGFYVLCGEKSNIVVVDLDDMSLEHNKKIYDYGSRYCKCSVKTRKGYHLYFKYIPEFNRTIHIKNLEFDIQSNKSVVLAPPCKYTIEDEEICYLFEQENPELVDMPDELIKYIRTLIKCDNELSNINMKISKYKQSDLDNYSKSTTLIEKLLDSLSDKRATNYDDWVKCGFALAYHNCNSEYFHNFSKRCLEKYDKDDCQLKYDYFLSRNGKIENPITIKTLWKWLSTDNHDVFCELLTEEKIPNYDNTVTYEDKFLQEKMIDLIAEDRKIFETLFNYNTLIDKSKSFKYFERYHIYLSDQDIIFKITYNGGSIESKKMPDKLYPNMKYEDKEFASLWLKSSKRKVYSSIDFDFSREAQHKEVFNLFTGFKYDNIEKNDESIDFFLDHLKYICQTDECYNYLINLFSHMVQKPGIKTMTATVIYGVQGIGKNSITYPLEKIFEGYTFQTADIEKITGGFNSFLLGKLLVIGDEIKAKAKNVADELKNSITSRTINITYKGKDTITSTNYINYIFTTNNELAFKIDPEGRRFFMIECPEEKKTKEYFDEYYYKLENEQYLANIYHYLKNIDLSNFNIRNIPKTDYKKANIANNLPPYIKMIYDNYHGFLDIPLCDEDTTDIPPVKRTARQLYDLSKEYCEYKHIQPNYTSKSCSMGLSKYLKDFKCYDTHKKINYYSLPRDRTLIEDTITKTL